MVLLSIFLGSFWLSRYSGQHGLTPWLGLAFPMAPAVLVSIDRLTVDVGLACLCVGFVWFRETDRRNCLYLALLAAPLCRDTGFVLLAGYVAALLWQRQWRRAAVFSTAALPAAVWYWLVSIRTAPDPTTWFTLWPLGGLVERMAHPFTYPFTMPVTLAATVLDYAALGGMLLAIAWALILACRKPLDPEALPILAFAGVASFLNSSDVWSEAYAFGRVLTPLLLLLALAALRQRRFPLALPLLLVTPRVLLQFAPQAWHVVRGIVS